MALIHRMRLSLMKGAHADLSSTAWQEIGVKPTGCGLRRSREGVCLSFLREGPEAPEGNRGLL